MQSSPNSFEIARLAAVIGGEVVNPDGATSFTAVNASSREVGPGALFFAIRGHTSDGHKYVDDAFSRGASGAVVEDAAVLKGRLGIVVKDTRRALSRSASFVAGDPSQRMKIIAVTGTNGKTTTNWLVHSLLLQLGASSVRFGTLGTKAQNSLRETIFSRDETLTTSDPVTLHSDLRRAIDAGVTNAVLETSSHAFDQDRVSDVAFDVGIFTNLTRDHLDYHRTMEHYFSSKAKLFTLMGEGTKSTKGAVVNLDVEYGAQTAAVAKEHGLRDFSFGRVAASAVRIVSFEHHDRRSIAVLAWQGREFRIESGFLGEHNAQNIAGAFAALTALGHDPEKLAGQFSRVPQVPGRLEAVGEGAVQVFVDYAHTPDALENVLRAARPMTKGKLWVLFGCGGDRDRGKRPQMAEVARRGADRVVVTSDNPRTEDPAAIIADIMKSGIAADLVEIDRRRAIESAIVQAGAGDVVILAGKGHEEYQIIGDKKSHFSDREEAERALAHRASRSKG